MTPLSYIKDFWRISQQQREALNAIRRHPPVIPAKAGTQLKEPVPMTTTTLTIDDIRKSMAKAELIAQKNATCGMIMAPDVEDCIKSSLEAHANFICDEGQTGGQFLSLPYSVVYALHQGEWATYNRKLEIVSFKGDEARLKLALNSLRISAQNKNKADGQSPIVSP